MIRENKKRKATIDDGMNPELVNGANFDGYLGIPQLEKPKEIIIPSAMIPFTYRHRITSSTEAICFNEMDEKFAEVLINPEQFVEEFKDRILITPDCSLYRDAPLAAQITNVYRNRAIGVFYQQRGCYVIPMIRWGNSLTYTTEVLPEKLAFLGAPKHSIVAIGTYGCIQSKSDKKYFKEGLQAMLEALEPEIVLVYGSIPKSVFSEFELKTTFVHYPDWTTRMHGGGR